MDADVLSAKDGLWDDYPVLKRILGNPRKTTEALQTLVAPKEWNGAEFVPKDGGKISWELFSGWVAGMVEAEKNAGKVRVEKGTTGKGDEKKGETSTHPNSTSNAFHTATHASKAVEKPAAGESMSEEEMTG